MAATQYLAFGTGVSANTYSFSTYNTDSSGVRVNGYTAGEADAQHINTVLRQVSVGVAGLASFAATYGSVDVNDDGNPVTVRTAIKSALDALYLTLALLKDSNYVQLGTDGFLGLPVTGGTLFIQWGQVAMGDTPTVTGKTVNFVYPKALTTAYAVMVCGMQNNERAKMDVQSYNATQAVIFMEEWTNHTQNATAQVLVIGFKSA